MTRTSDRHVRVPLTVRVNEDLVLDAGRVEETDRDGPQRHIHPPATTMFEQVIDYLSRLEPEDPGPLRIGEEAVAATAVCLRWGSYLAVLADRDRPLWSRASEPGISRIADSEMARINIEASAAMEQWIGLMRDEPERYKRLAQAALSHLPLTLRNVKRTREPPDLLALATPKVAAQLVEAQPEQAAKVRPEVAAHPDRVLANALINFCWRNNGPVEDIHAGRYPGYPLTMRRIRPSEQRALMRFTAGRLAQGIVAVGGLIHEESSRDWTERVLPYHLVPWWLVTPSGWSLTEKTRDVWLPRTEAGLTGSLHHDLE